MNTHPHTHTERICERKSLKFCGQTRNLKVSYGLHPSGNILNHPGANTVLLLLTNCQSGPPGWKRTSQKHSNRHIKEINQSATQAQWQVPRRAAKQKRQSHELVLKSSVSQEALWICIPLLHSPEPPPGKELLYIWGYKPNVERAAVPTMEGAADARLDPDNHV